MRWRVSCNWKAKLDLLRWRERERMITGTLAYTPVASCKCVSHARRGTGYNSWLYPWKLARYPELILACWREQSCWMTVQSLRSCPWGLESLAICTPCHKGLQAFCKFGKFKKFWASQVALMVKNPPAKARDTRDAGLIPGLGGFPRERHGNPLQYPSLENPMDRGAWPATVHRVTKSQLKGLSTPQRSMDSHPFFASWSPLGFPLFKLWLFLFIPTTVDFSEDLPKLFPQLPWDNSS